MSVRPSRPIRVVVVDDEPPARANLEALLSEIPSVDVVASLGSAAELDQVCARQRAELVLLDISMPGIDGLTWARNRGRGPAVVFVTAHAPHAIEAFDLDVVDYVLKPVRRDRLARAIGRVASALGRGAADRLTVRTGGREVHVPVDGIEWLRATGNYVEVHETDRWHLVRDTLEALLNRLGPDFVRTHRSMAVRASRVTELRRTRNGHVVVLGSGHHVPVARRRVRAVRASLRGAGPRVDARRSS